MYTLFNIFHVKMCMYFLGHSVYAYLTADHSANEHHNFAHNMDILNQLSQQALF
jgi:hypothetical protein